jgi:hypothetical protein
MDCVLSKETLERQYTIIVSQLQVRVQGQVYEVEFYNEPALAAKIRDYFAQENARGDAALLLQAMFFALDEKPLETDPDCLHFLPLEEIQKLLAKLDPIYDTPSLDNFADDFALNGQIKRL